MQAAEAVVRILEEEGIQVAFGIPAVIMTYMGKGGLRPGRRLEPRWRAPYLIDVIVEREADCSMSASIDAAREFV